MTQEASLIKETAMTDRLKGVYVAFTKDIRVDDAEPIIHAIKMIKGVLDVEQNVADPDDWMNRRRIRGELAEQLMAILYPAEKDE